MKKATILFFAFVGLIFFTQCRNSELGTVSTDAETRGKTISALVNNDSYMHQVMDSMRTIHPDIVLTTVYMIMKDDKAMQTRMMGDMMSMCKTDSAMCNAMMGKTMDMCEADQSKCSMMMGTMQTHPNVMKSMKGMYDMPGMKMGQDKQPQHSH